MRLLFKPLFLLYVLMSLVGLSVSAQDRSLSRYGEYAYVGEWDTRNPDRQVLRIIKDGQVDFEYVLPLRDDWNRVLEFDDVRILPDGTILYAAMSQLGLHEHWNAQHAYSAIDLIYQKLP